ncbi:RipA family octameric membrane protein [Nocardia asteroides]|uniref:RipA family octameric membrane protein n=1 Tax=Nocardia asteroides TaxID=1824 RepID=UPI003405121C
MNPDDQQSTVSSRLWNDVSEGDVDRSSAYDSAVLEQYRLCVEMADRVSARRGLANSFFLTLNTGIFTLVTVFGKSPPTETAGWLVIPLIAVLGQCFAWFYVVRSYRLLNCAKYQVVGALEERLPASPFWRAEWWALGEGRDRARYWPLSHIEQWVPVLFAVAYVSGFLAIVFH